MSVIDAIKYGSSIFRHDFCLCVCVNKAVGICNAYIDHISCMQSIPADIHFSLKGWFLSHIYKLNIFCDDLKLKTFSILIIHYLELIVTFNLFALGRSVK